MPIAPATVPNQHTELRDERIRQGLSLRELAHFAGCSHVTICRLELGTLDVAPATRARIARALRVPVARLWQEGQ
jgi:transcriptional regulator with XRE-family HTH domain